MIAFPMQAARRGFYMFDLFSGIMFVLACWSGRRQGSLFAGALVGCFVVYAHFWGGWLLSRAVRKAQGGEAQGIELASALSLTAVCLALSFALPIIVLKMFKSPL